MNGIWYSSAGSKLYLNEDGSTLTGRFESTQDPDGPVPVLGSLDPDQSASFRLLSFSVNWAQGDTPAGERSVTSYTSQHRAEDHGEVVCIEVTFLLVEDTPSTALWKSSHISSDVFKRTS